MISQSPLTVRAEAERLLNEILDVLQPLFDRLAAAPTWQPIATAPKDGRMLLLYPSSCWTEDTELDYEVSYWDDDLGAFAQAQHPDDFDGYTHWMPLPSPPLAPSAEPPTED